MLVLINCFFAFSQELNCNIIVNSDQIEQTNQQVFKTLERALNDYVNKTRWTNREYTVNERINCNMLITVTSFDNNNRFDATLQIQSNRPVFNSTYETPVFNYQDKQFSFNYLEFEPLFYNSNTFESNLVSVITYYIYIILGIDADTFALNGGTDYFNQARSIVNLAQGSGYLGWRQIDGNRTRWELIDNLLSNTFSEYRQAMYEYHRLGLDLMAEDTQDAKENISKSIKLLGKLNNKRPNSFVLQTFFDAKADEIKSIFSDGPKVDIRSLKSILEKIAPLHASNWSDIKY
ncbi:DUF4835 family protein [Abyssalbus ytuae]|uniref:DUF4835 family protein n=1 Tax=Abyssalbus ytuae TaxID=2926907 RepID=A0A9E6ZYS5_9FLAO|nr:DUF4835 family protein [Abyssalbus ytuae]UOB17677.1 DUF4835 family protein [Abyssalbus ytuae]